MVGRAVLRSAALTLAALLGCARAPMPDADADARVTTRPLDRDDDNDNGDTPPDENQVDPPPAGDGDALPYEPEPPEEETTPPDEPDASDDAGTTPTDPEDDGLLPSPKNAASCPDKAPKPPFSVSFCNAAESLRCLYGKSYSCYCAVGGWICTGG